MYPDIVFRLMANIHPFSFSYNKKSFGWMFKAINKWPDHLSHEGAVRIAGFFSIYYGRLRNDPARLHAFPAGLPGIPAVNPGILFETRSL